MWVEAGGGKSKRYYLEYLKKSSQPIILGSAGTAGSVNMEERLAVLTVSAVATGSEGSQGGPALKELFTHLSREERRLSPTPLFPRVLRDLHTGLLHFSKTED